MRHEEREERTFHFIHFSKLNHHFPVELDLPINIIFRSSWDFQRIFMHIIFVFKLIVKVLAIDLAGKNK